ncbi:Helicase associated domain protein [Streptomyces sp. NPDC057909]|uniref:Helicase associated domain protein n=1 Tax=Streptomyces sp. NPDC057909 TaxID=3346277 RepID=UPI0036E18307
MAHTCARLERCWDSTTHRQIRAPPKQAASGSSPTRSPANAEREELWKALDHLREGDTLVVPPKPAEPPSPTPVKKSTAAPSAAFERGLAALAQYIAREGTTTVKRPHREAIVLHGQEHELALGLWFANQKQRRDKLTQPQRTALAEPGIDWAQ